MHLSNEFFFQETHVLPLTINNSWNTNWVWRKSQSWCERYFLDISNAFYKVCHDCLLYKLKAFDVQGELLSLWGNFKSPKAQTKSGLKTSNVRVEKSHFWRSILRSLLFLIYINDGIKLLCKISSDDTFLFSKVHNINKSVNELNADLEKISQWAYQ